MNKNLKKEKILMWLNRLELNLINFKNNYNTLSIYDKLDFIKTQYYLLFTLSDVLENKTIIQGVDNKTFNNNKNT
jgi:hypothetical protein